MNHLRVHRESYNKSRKMWKATKKKLKRQLEIPPTRRRYEMVANWPEKANAVAKHLEDVLQPLPNNNAMDENNYEYISSPNQMFSLLKQITPAEIKHIFQNLKKKNYNRNCKQFT